MAHAAGDAGPDFALPGQEDEGAAVLDRDAARREAGLLERLELGGKRRPEAEVCKAHWRGLLGYGWTDAVRAVVDSGGQPCGVAGRAVRRGAWRRIGRSCSFVCLLPSRTGTNSG